MTNFNLGHVSLRHLTLLHTYIYIYIHVPGNSSTKLEDETDFWNAVVTYIPNASPEAMVLRYGVIGICMYLYTV